MSAKKCCVPNCTVTRADYVPLHSFPNPEKEAERFRTWLYNVGGDILSLDNAFIHKRRKLCHHHFEERFHTWVNTLTRDAVPTLHLSGFRKKATKRPLSDVTNTSSACMSDPQINEPSTSHLVKEPQMKEPSTSHLVKEPQMKEPSTSHIIEEPQSGQPATSKAKGILPQDCEDTADVLIFFDDLFDSMNGSYHQSQKKTGKDLLGPVTPKSRHSDIWNKSKVVLRTMKFVTKEGKLVKCFSSIQDIVINQGPDW
ncbi:THAP domain-containing protein [Phthorimaea operculella]|nr:THAP domain-containing protein [Phthorimaea operculella]